ncbi:carboxymuconolactone decarboxylase family protein [Seonamhaeicola marinus]|uniref:Carboxymuconolactone decarboxylase family protein n=1 Tax=Seonamhaeicola marinus TaxID=1912246 RepID=A0A5D0J9S8_9FLAO|nr:carboxymuconolactone decarboxylase family protein [Seonamhaeicola marinus]TYA92329.1 carboxymuconolactone decarboxylase family protein [Seonamhaeicola marinus]
MQTRVNIHTTEPQAINAVFGLENYIAGTNLPKKLIHLIKVRASQINGCAFCINMHTREAIKDGETHKRLFLLDAWKETELFTEEEQAVLQLTEEMTLIHEGGVKDSTYGFMETFFNYQEISQIILVISTINVWNRIAISTHMPLDD